jgi:4-hydroxybenzoyl-CoA thioesterase
VLGLTVTRIGERSIGLDVQGRVGDELRLKARQTLVTMNLDTTASMPIPPDIRAGLARYCRPAPEIAPESFPTTCGGSDAD